MNVINEYIINKKINYNSLVIKNIMIKLRKNMCFIYWMNLVSGCVKKYIEIIDFFVYKKILVIRFRYIN